MLGSLPNLRHIAVAAAGTSLGLACGASPIPRAKAPEAPTTQSKCRVMASQLSPLVTEWPASEKANLEARLGDGGVAVAYTGCEMRLLPDCRPGGRYRWQRTSTSTDSIEIDSEDELYAKLPLGAVSLEGELRSAGRLAMQTTVAGQLRLEGLAVDAVPREGACRNATHVVSALSVGAFELKSGGALKAGASVEAQVAGGRVATQSREEVLREAGLPELCSESTEDQAHPECSSPVQVFLSKLPWVEAEEVPPGMVKVAFSSATPDTSWDVIAAGRTVCETPCEQLVSAETAVTLRDRDPSFLSPSDEVDLPPLSPYLGSSGVEVRAEAYSFGLFSGGLVVTAIGGMMALTGALLAPMGCGGDRDGMCQAGIGLLVAGPVVAAPGVLMIVMSGPDAELLPLGRVSETAGASSALWLGPQGLGGRF